MIDRLRRLFAGRTDREVSEAEPTLPPEPPTAAVPAPNPEKSRAKKPPELTFILTYYNQQEMLRRLLEAWRAYPARLRDAIQFLIVDDGSRAPALEVLDPVPGELNITLYRILEDKYCNIGGARNLGTRVCETEWMLHTDLDLVVPPAAAEAMLQLVRMNERKIHKFNRRFSSNGKLKVHPGTMLLTRSVYWEVGGCDEDFVGNYGQTDVHFFLRAKKVVETVFHQGIVMLHYELGDTVGIDRTKLGPNQELLKKKLVTGNWSTDFIRFEWERQL